MEHGILAVMTQQNTESPLPSTHDFPSIPPFWPLRIAKLLDVMRMGIITYAAFEKTTQLTWTFPNHTCWPHQVLQLERQRLASYMHTPNHVVVVVEDLYDPDEAAKTNITIPSNDPAPCPVSRWTEGEAIVGVAVWKFESDSTRIGQFSEQQQAGLFPRFSRVEPHLPFHEEHQDRYWDAIDEMNAKYFGPCGMMLETLAVHPAYWGRGHGKRLVEWSRALAHMDGISMGVLASDISLKFYQKQQYQLLDTLRLKGDEASPAGMTTYIMVYAPSTLQLQHGNQPAADHQHTEDHMPTRVQQSFTKRLREWICRYTCPRI